MAWSTVIQSEGPSVLPICCFRSFGYSTMSIGSPYQGIREPRPPIMPHPAIHSSAMTSIRFDHIAIGVPRIAEVPAFLEGILGGVARYGRSTGGAFIWTVWRFEGGGRIEILEPFGKDGFLHRFLAQRGPGIHHVTFKVPSLDEICERARGHGYTPVGRDDSDPSWK